MTRSGLYYSLRPTYDSLLGIHSMNTPDRRTFLAATAAMGAAALSGRLLAEDKPAEPFKISLAEWSLHRTLREGKLDNLDFAKTSKEDFGIDAIEFVNQFF